MKALTISQPWAMLHVAPCSLTANSPAKRVESRGWLATVKDKVVAIHAGKGIDRAAREMVSDGHQFVEPFRSLLRACGYSALDPWHRDYADNFVSHGAQWKLPRGAALFSRAELKYYKPLPRGAIIGTVQYSEAVTGGEILARIRRNELPALEAELGFYSEAGRWGFVSRNAKLLDTPVECRGALGFWTIDAKTEAKLNA